MSDSRKIAIAIRRFLIPGFVVTVYGFLKWRAAISTRAEVELSSHLSLGRNTVVSSFTKIKCADGPLTTGAKCGFGTGCFIAAGPGGIELGDHVIVGPNVSVVASNYKYTRVGEPLENQGYTSLGIRIGANVWIGANSVILDGTVIGENCIVVAGSVVNRRFAPNCIIQGNPAKVIGRRA